MCAGSRYSFGCFEFDFSLGLLLLVFPGGALGKFLDQPFGMVVRGRHLYACIIPVPFLAAIVLTEYVLNAINSI